MLCCVRHAELFVELQMERQASLKLRAAGCDAESGE
jgi:hypothetical protein